MTRLRPLTLDDLPMFADDEKLGEAVLGYDRRREFKGLAEVLEGRGMPKVDPFWGGRCVPLVKNFLFVHMRVPAASPSNGAETLWPQHRQVARRAQA